MKRNGTDIASTTETVPAKKKSKKKWIIIICVILALILIGAIFGSDDKSADDKTTDSKVIDEINQSEKPASSSEKKISAGHSVTTKDLKISYLSCDINFKKYNPYIKPEKGNKVIRAVFEFENISSVDQFISGTECYADNSKCELFFGADDTSVDTINTISPGRKVKATIYYQVPANAKNIEIEIDGNFWSNEKIIFEVK